MSTHTPVGRPVRLDFDGLAPLFSRAVSDLDDAADQQAAVANLPEHLRELIKLRVSQMNGCAYCVDMHSREARNLGVSAQRVDAVAIWHESSFFDPAERAALHLATAMATMSTTPVADDAVAEAISTLGEERTAALIAIIATVTVWNSIGVTTHCWTVKRRD